MSSDRSTLSRREVWGLLGASAVLTVWYAYPQILFSLYPLYELARLIFPLPDLSPAAKSILERLGLPG
jgi:hypothetical protein